MSNIWPHIFPDDGLAHLGAGDEEGNGEDENLLVGRRDGMEERSIAEETQKKGRKMMSCPSSNSVILCLLLICHGRAGAG